MKQLQHIVRQSSSLPSSTTLYSFRCSLLCGRGRAADGLVLLPVQRPVLRGAVPHGATRGTAYVLTHGRLPLAARRQGALLEAVLGDIRTLVCVAFVKHLVDHFRCIQQASCLAHLHHRCSRPFCTQRDDKRWIQHGKVSSSKDVLNSRCKIDLLCKRAVCKASCGRLHTVHHAKDERLQLVHLIRIQTRHSGNAAQHNASSFDRGGVAQTKTLKLQLTSSMRWRLINNTRQLTKPLVEGQLHCRAPPWEHRIVVHALNNQRQGVGRKRPRRGGPSSLPV